MSTSKEKTSMVLSSHETLSEQLARKSMPMTGGPAIAQPDRKAHERAFRRALTEYKNREDLASGITIYLNLVLQLPPEPVSTHYAAVGTLVADMLDQDQPPDRIICEVNDYIGL